ncbi:hypothetical protein [Ignatzschineria cameli]|uniref:hypothetical protein n=1 Tax=Ignatzschineria cameli TaxID=2182793 RepID=UPI001057AC14|nr:hypothetical protein [Ignatzschineria cameli]
MSCRSLLSRSSQNRVPAIRDLLSPVNFEIKKFERCRISLLHASIYHAPADGNFPITPKRYRFNDILPASRMPNGGHAPVKRARWSAPAPQKPS